MTSEELKQLVEGVKNNDPEATEKLCQCFEPLIKGQAKKYTNITTPMEDAISLGWIAFLEFVKGYEEKDYESLPGLLKEVVKNKIINAVITRAYFDGRVQYIEDVQQYGDDGLEIEKLIESNDLKQAISKLKKKEKQFIYLRYYNELNYLQLERFLKKSKYTLFKRNAKILHKLKYLMK